MQFGCSVQQEQLVDAFSVYLLGRRSKRLFATIYRQCNVSCRLQLIMPSMGCLVFQNLKFRSPLPVSKHAVERVTANTFNVILFYNALCHVIRP